MTVLPVISEGAETDLPGLLAAVRLCLELRGTPKSETAIGSTIAEDAPDVAEALVTGLGTLGLRARWYAAESIPEDVLPAVLLLADGRSAVVVGTAPEALLVRWPGSPADAQPEPVLHFSGHRLLLFAQTQVLDLRADELVPEARTSWFWSTLWDYRRYFYEATALSAIINILSLSGIIFMMTVYDRILPNQAYVTLWSLAAGVAVAMLFELATRTIRGGVLDSAGKKLDLVLGDRIFRQVLATRLEYRSQSSGAFANVIKEFESVRAFVTSASLTTVADLPFALLFLLVTALIGGPLILVPLAAFLIVGTLSLLVQIPMARIANETLRVGAVRHGTVIESLEGLEPLKALRAEARMQYRHERASMAIARSAIRSQEYSNLISNVTTFVQQAAAALLLIWGVYLASDGVISAGALVACVQLNSRALAPLVSLAGLAVRFQQARSALSSLNRIMDLPTERERGRTYLSGAGWRGAVELRNVDFAYDEGDPPVLRNISVRIGAGERVAILGRVGSGKSTLLRLACGLYRPTSGQVFLDGVEMAAVEPADVRATVALVGQEARLFHGTLRENVRIAAPTVEDEEMLRVARATGVAEIAAAHPRGFERPVGERGTMLSGGQRQAVSIARALLATPRMLLLDEPTSAMDQRSETQILETLAKTAEDGAGYVIVTHKQSVLAIVDRVIVMDQGQIVADGPREDVLRALGEGRVRAIS